MKVYVAGPYSKGNKLMKLAIALEVAEEIWRRGGVPYVPHLTHYWESTHHHGWVEWLDYDKNWLLVCDAVFRIPGESTGADLETQWARENHIPVFTSIDKLFAYPFDEKL